MAIGTKCYERRSFRVVALSIAATLGALSLDVRAQPEGQVIAAVGTILQDPLVEPAVDISPAPISIHELVARLATTTIPVEANATTGSFSIQAEAARLILADSTSTTATPTTQLRATTTTARPATTTSASTATSTPTTSTTRPAAPQQTTTTIKGSATPEVNQQMLPPDSDFVDLKGCEAPDDGWAANTGNGYFGGLQFDQPTWEANGGLEFAPRADLATQAQQIIVGRRTYWDPVNGGDGSWRPWPSCSKQLGLKVY